MKTLHLVLKSKWYDMIDRGEKKEEYRELTLYWKKRLIEDLGDFYPVLFKDYKWICFHKGYTSTTMTFKVEDIKIGRGNPEWGAPTDRPVFIIKLGERL